MKLTQCNSIFLHVNNIVLASTLAMHSEEYLCFSDQQNLAFILKMKKSF